MDRLPQTFEDHSFTPKPLDTENKGNSCGCYQIVIKGTFVKPENLENTGFLESDTSFPLASVQIICELLRSQFLNFESKGRV